MFWGLVEMMSGLVNTSFSLPEWQAVKMIFFAPCNSHIESKTSWFIASDDAYYNQYFHDSIHDSDL